MGVAFCLTVGVYQLILRSEMRYYAKGSIVADSREEAKGLMVITSGQVEAEKAEEDITGGEAKAINTWEGCTNACHWHLPFRSTVEHCSKSEQKYSSVRDASTAPATTSTATCPHT